MKDRKCELCHFFKVNTYLGPNSGECHRRSPSGMDSGLMGNAFRDEQNFQAGVVLDTMFSETPVYLYRNQFELLDEADPLPICKTLADGFDDNTVFPFVQNSNAQIYYIKIHCSRANTGAASVGTLPKLKIAFLSVSSLTASLLGTVEINIPSTSVGIFGNANDNYFTVTHTLATPLTNPGGSSLGFFVDLDTTNSPDYIAQIRNVNVSVRSATIEPVTSNPFSGIDDKTQAWCGEFKPASDNNLRCWDCDHFYRSEPGVNNSGNCRRNAPSKFDARSIPSINQPSDTVSSATLFPLISDGTENFCGEFKPAVDAIPDPV